eukprot:TRINITY_DN7134_c0_g1_i1.p1 TRINITY_DN7134_c0_g1~~TRINITY_DN7134_c0_g1_i1.p1  ORF type:complete len:352 (-),score=53.72 TRINITY_DN7134_c0_g1_i1:215-1270(-)
MGVTRSTIILIVVATIGTLLGLVTVFSIGYVPAVFTFGNCDSLVSTAKSLVPTFPVPGPLSPLFSTQPLTKSLHPKWKLWIEMSSEERERAMEKVGSYIEKYGKLIKPDGIGLNKLRSVKHGGCEFDKNISSTGHTICGPPPRKPCFFISFGINDDPSFDREVAKTWGCRGFAGDPTVQHPSKLHELVTFHNVAATTLQDNEERLINKGGTTEWWTTSFPKLRYFLGLEKIELLKIDCEGCEVALSRDMLREDPYFLHRVDQISIETHVTKTWMTTTEHVYYFGLMFALLEEAGFKMEWSSVFGCSKRHEVAGCMPELGKYHWPCGYNPWPGKTSVVKGWSCQEFTWKRYE